MSEAETVFSSKIRYVGVLNFKDFYRFCYDWLSEETELMLVENKYEEKIDGDIKNIEVEWTGARKITDYFKYKVKVKFRVLGLKKVEVIRDGKKEKTNEGSVEVKASGDLVRDYQGKFELGAGRKFLRGIYDKWVIPSRIEEYQGKLVGKINEFLNQAKAWLDLEGKK
ncbi:hypothetical protein HYT23_03500 [Candidatus Pacearchaeota archaeon]|nr:hypothetical protein [Candidatus Pacearchaeota archaeon]